MLITVIVYDNESGTAWFEMKERVEEVVQALALDRSVANGNKNGITRDKHNPRFQRQRSLLSSPTLTSLKNTTRMRSAQQDGESINAVRRCDMRVHLA